MIRWIVIVGLMVASLLVGTAMVIDGYWAGLLLLAIIAASWLAGIWYGRSWLTTLGLVGLILVTAVGGILELLPVLLLTAVALALFAWDMGNYGRALAVVPDVRDEPGLIKIHMQWAGGMIGLGWLLGLIAINVQLPLNLGWTFGLGLVVVLGLRWLVRRLQREPMV